MASEVQIAKLSLQNLGDRYDINSLDENTSEAEQVNLVFNDIRDMLLRSHPWKFARRFTSPGALSGTVPDQWGNMFTYPSDALKVIRVVNPLGRMLPPIKFSISRNSSDVKVILCDEDEPEFEYIKKVTNTSEFDPSFTIALSWQISAAIAMPITGDIQILQMAEQKAQIKTNQAMVDDSNEGVEPEQTRDPDWITARQ